MAKRTKIGLPIGSIQISIDKRGRTSMLIDGRSITPVVADAIDRWVKYAELGLTTEQAERLERERKQSR